MMDNCNIENLIKGYDFEHAIQILRWLLQPLGVWPLKSAGYPSLLRPISILMTIWSAAFLIIPGISAIIREKNGFSLRLRFFGPISFCLVTAFKYFSFLIKNHQLYSYLVNVAIDWRELKNNNKHRIIMLQKTQISRLFMISCTFVQFLGGVFYNVVLPLALPPMHVGNVTIRNLPFAAYYRFFDQYADPYYYMVFIMQSVSCLVLDGMCSGVCCMTIQSVLHISGRYDITSLMIKDFNQNFDDKSFKAVVKFQQKSLAFATDIEDFLSEILMAEFFGSTCNICLLGYYLLTDVGDTLNTVTYAFLWLSFVVNIYMFCYLGEHLTEKCESVGEVVYMMDWFNFPAKKSRDLFLIILFCQRPVFITAGKMVNFSLFTFASVMKAAAAYLNFLYSMR